MNPYKMYDDCDPTKPTHLFGANVNSTGIGYHEANLYSQYLKGTVGGEGEANGNCIRPYHSSLRLKNGACVYFSNRKIVVDVNGNKKPNDASDRFCLYVRDYGILEDLDDVTGDTCRSLDNIYDACPNGRDESLDCCVNYWKIQVIAQYGGNVANCHDYNQLNGVSIVCGSISSAIISWDEDGCHYH